MDRAALDAEEAQELREGAMNARSAELAEDTRRIKREAEERQELSERAGEQELAEREAIAREQMMEEDEREEARQRARDEDEARAALDESGVRSRGATAEETAAFDAAPHRKTYRTFLLINGRLYSPMRAQERDPRDGKYHLGPGIELGSLQVAEEHPDDTFEKDGKFYTKLKKEPGSKVTDLSQVEYAPYWHSSNSLLNDQFSGAYLRPSLVTVESEILESEASTEGWDVSRQGPYSGDAYLAPKANKTVGAHAWHSGTVAKDLPADSRRMVYLTRMLRPVRILSDAETAQRIVDDFKGNMNKSGPYDPRVFPPSLRRELAARGMQFKKDETPAINGTAQHHGETASSGGTSSLPSRGTASRKPALSNKARQRIANGTNVVKRKIRDFKNNDFKIDVSSLDKAIGGLRKMFNFSYEGGSSYDPIATPNGIIGFRLADHNANGNNFSKDAGDSYVSVYVARREFEHRPTGIPYTEFRAPVAEFEKNPAAVVKAIVSLVDGAIETGRIEDTTGIMTGKDYPVERDASGESGVRSRGDSVAPAGRQKQAGVADPDASAEIAKIPDGRFATVRSRGRGEFEEILKKKRPDLDAKATVKNIFALKTPKERKIALHWIVRGGLALPEDA